MPGVPPNVFWLKGQVPSRRPKHYIFKMVPNGTCKPRATQENSIPHENTPFYIVLHSVASLLIYGPSIQAIPYSNSLNCFQKKESNEQKEERKVKKEQRQQKKEMKEEK